MAGKKLQVRIAGVKTREDLPIIRDVVNADMEEFDEYLKTQGQDRLVGFERTTLRTFVAWKILGQGKEKKDGNQAGSPPHV